MLKAVNPFWPLVRLIKMKLFGWSDLESCHSQNTHLFDKSQILTPCIVNCNSLTTTHNHEINQILIKCSIYCLPLQARFHEKTQWIILTLSYCQSCAVCKESLECYFTLLKQTLEQNDLMDRNACIYNMDETGMPLDSK